MIELEESIHIPLPREHVFAVAARPEHMPLWNPAVLESEVVGEMERGATVLQRIELLGRCYEAEYRVSRYEPPRRVTYTSTVGPVEVEGTMRFAAASGGTLVRWGVLGDCRGFLQVAEGLLARAGRRELRACLDTLRRVVEELVAA